MGKVALTIAALLLCGSLSLVHAQNRVETGLLLDYLNVSQTKTNNFGMGGRFGYRVHRNVMIEGELTYGYGVNFAELYGDATNGDVTAIERTSIGPQIPPDRLSFTRSTARLTGECIMKMSLTAVKLTKQIS